MFMVANFVVKCDMTVDEMSLVTWQSNMTIQLSPQTREQSLMSYERSNDRDWLWLSPGD